MEFFFEMLLTALLALFCSFLLANLVSSANDLGGNDPSSDDQSSEKPEIIGVGGEFETEEEVLSVKKMDARVMETEMNLADENVELVVRFVNGADGVGEVEDAATGNAETRKDREEELVAFSTAEAESTAVLSPETNAIVEEEMTSRGVQVEKSDSAAEEIGPELEEADESSGSVSPEEKIVLQEQEDRSESTELGRSGCVENEESRGDVVVAEVEDEVRVEETNTVAETEIDTKGEGDDEEKEELSIEEDDDDDDDDWEGIERSELEKSFAAAANLLEESGKSEDIGAESKMDLYGLHKIATEGPCREPQPMAVMVSARAKWNAWQKLGNMSQEDAMEQYLALVSKEVPGLMTGHTVGKMSEIETSLCLPPNSGSLEDPTNLDTTAVDESRKMGKGETSG
ncbi:PREDICTED: acyl-CoA-binding domain-containing protein 3-like [Camelina sativa]|uniref:Acyl-CoA-binding domain-containing protein 3-like n=1 Tax=Camelina sativa TaxID=90675 RepID=A0ABM0UCB4_CAMSA|nr:PREDICTED: acyl-CoA-binding domain-containing protein 3-like [Camelina sativa]